MLAGSFLLLLSSVVGLAAAQTIDPDSVPISTRNQWCQDQEDSCPLICLQLANVTGSPESNSCDAKTLDYSCVCSNGQSPNSSEYSQTIPYFICTEANNQCVTNCEGDASCQSACRDDHPCGAQNPKRYNITTTTSATSNPTASASGTDSGSVVYTGFGTGTASTASAKKGSASTFVLEIGQVYGLFGLVAGFLGGFALLL